jgi:Family of unknown function (DUF6526)
MQAQNFKNHTRWVKGYHFVLFGILLLTIICAFVNLYNEYTAGEGLLESFIFLLITVSLTLLGWFARVFALKAQDRAIRAEENFRYYVLTGKPFDHNLRMGQIIALRFASDNELVALTEKALKENLSGKEIKQEIKNWKADHNRA